MEPNNSKRNALPAIKNKNCAKRRYYGEKIETSKFNNLFSTKPVH